MLPDRDREELTRQVYEYFGVSDPDLSLAALELQDEGWTWDQMRPLMTRIFNAGFDDGFDKGVGQG